ncbi:Card1-like endonuclease domain-containing protein [Treponema sp.]|uniref:Card1-like endonuclease domain-containing protein n=1 Tax=Treponema sp. TaxID=166 RepID=UPI003FD776AC
MTEKIIVSLISEQTIPNVQFIKWYTKNNFQKYDLLFVSTKKMEQNLKSEFIKNALDGISNFLGEIKSLIVEENDMQNIQSNLKAFFEKIRYKDVIVNITGGTKMMSLISFQFFSNLKNSQIFYQPIAKPLLELFPESKEFEVNEILTLEEYLKANGIKYRFDNNCVRDWEFNKTVANDLIIPNRTIIAAMVELQNTKAFKHIFDKKNLNLFELDDSKFVLEKNKNISKNTICTFLDYAGFDSRNLTKNDLRYFTGGWFEEFVYQKVLNEINVKPENVALNVHIEKGSDKNELDVVYLDLKNQLHVIECKSFLEGKDGAKVLNEALYKLQAIIKSKFGLNVKSHLYTKSVIDKESALNRASDFNIELVDGTKL